MEAFIAWIEKNIMPGANKLASERHLKAIRDTFMTILPPIFFGGIIAVINSAPVTDDTTNGILLAWAAFDQQNALVLGWLNQVTLGFLSLYVCIGITYYLAKSYDMEVFLPIIISLAGYCMLVIDPQEISFGNVLGQLTYFDGKGALIVTGQLGDVMKESANSVPPALMVSFGSLVPCLIVLGIDSVIFILCKNIAGTCFAAVVIGALSPAVEATDNMAFAILVAFLLNFGWFFGIHDTVWSGFLSPIEYGTLSVNAAAQAASTALPHVFTVSFWCYFGIIGGLGNCLALGLLCLRSKNKEVNLVGKLGIVPAFFGISEPITFGLPIMLNPLLFIPSIVTSIVNVIISYSLMSANIIGRTYAMLSYNMPSVFGAYFSTGDWKAVLLIVVLIMLDMVIYFPFLKAYERSMGEETTEANAAV